MPDSVFKKLIFESKGKNIMHNSENKIDIKSGFQLTIDGEPFMTLEKGKVTIHGSLTVKAESIVIQPDKTLKLKGNEVLITPDTKITAKAVSIDLHGTGMIEAKSDGMITLKGSVIKLN